MGHVFVSDDSNFSSLIHIQRYGNNVCSVQICRENTGGNRIGIQTYHKINNSSTVRYYNVLFYRSGTQDFFRKIEGITYSLVIVIPLGVLKNSVFPILLSISWIAFERLGWAIKSDFAASLMEPFSTTAITYFNCCNVTQYHLRLLTSNLHYENL